MLLKQSCYLRSNAMKKLLKRWITLVFSVIFLLSAGPLLAAEDVIQVSLWDRGGMAQNMLDHGGMGRMMGGANHGSGMGPMGINISMPTIKTGKVTFNVSNDSSIMPHEMVISPIKDANTALPYNQATRKVDETKAGAMGEVESLAPGKKGSLTLTLKPGKYILYCNLPGHYALGMWTVLTVTP